jgi:hypothetical protein
MKYTATLSSYEYVYINNNTGNQVPKPTVHQVFINPGKYNVLQVYTKAATIKANTLRELDAKAWQLNESMKLNGQIEVYIHFK